MPDYRQVPFEVIRNRAKLKASQQAGCYRCGHIFAVNEIQHWTDNDETALCPSCGQDSVLPEASGYTLTKEELQAILNYWLPKPNKQQ